MSNEQVFGLLGGAMLLLTLLACVAALLTSTQVGSLRSLIVTLVDSVAPLLQAHTATIEELRKWIASQTPVNPQGPQPLLHDRPARVLDPPPSNDVP